LFVRDFERDNGRYITEEVTPGCEWVLAGEGTATRKYDGTCVLLDKDGQWWARREVKKGKTAPPSFWEEQYDATTGKFVGWEPIEQSSFVKFWREVAEPLEEFGQFTGRTLEPGTFELIGPKINGNPERCELHRLQRHAMATQVEIKDLSFQGLSRLMAELAVEGWEGIVWHHPDGRMAKLKARDIRP
jgi:hypothetical protein